jgi:hypothetical protein
MTQDEIIEMARKIATEASKVGPYRTWTHEHAMSLIMKLVEASAAKEREACALICAQRAKDFKDLLEKYGHEHDDGARVGASQCEQMIRARGQA